MTKVFFAADCHFHHNNIIKYCNRPFKNINHMNEEIVERWNRKVRCDDLVYHIGDFAFKGMNQSKLLEDRLNGRIVHIRGNHDKNNGVKSYITHAIMKFGRLNIYVVHRPPDRFQEGTLEETLISACDLILCGHIHELWKHKIIKGKICVNVGVDVWQFEPVSIHSILKYVSRIKRKGCMKDEQRRER